MNKTAFFNQQVSTVIGTVFLGTFALGAALIMIRASDMEDPIVNVLTAQIVSAQER